MPINLRKIFTESGLGGGGVVEGGTMGCHSMLTENDNFVTNALRGDLSTVNVRP